MTNYHFAASGPVETGDDAEWNDETPEHEAHGEIVGGIDTYEFSGVPMGFYCDDPANAWTLDIALDFGAEWFEQTPEDLNPGYLEIRGKGHYRAEILDVGMILRGELADDPDRVATGPNTMVAGNVRGGTDSFRAWPPEAVVVKGDQDIEWRIANNEADDSWKSAETIRTAMVEF